MSGITAAYGRLGSEASGDPQVAELLSRTVDGQYRTTKAFENSLAEMRAQGQTPWTIPVKQMSKIHAQWLAAIYWQAATNYLDGVVLSCENDNFPPDAYSECDRLCDLAGSRTMEAIRLQSELSQGKTSPNATLAEFPDLKISRVGYMGVWGVFEAIYLQVVNDLRTIENFDMPKQMRDVLQSARSSLLPKADVFRYVQASWNSSTSVDNRLQLLRESLSEVADLFMVGQQLWAPYLFGEVYVSALRYKPSLDDVELGFDPWCLTDPLQRQVRIGNAESRDELVKFWSAVADPASARLLSEQVTSALSSDKIRLRNGRGYGQVPWSAQFLVRFPIQLGSRTFAPGDLVAYYPSEQSGKYVIEVRRTGRVTSILEALGQNGN